MPFRRPLPNACLSRTHSLEELSPPELSSMSCSSLLSGAVSETYTLSDGVRTGEVLVYYDSAWSTDEVCFPPVRQRRGPHYQPNVACRPRAVSIGVGVTAATASPRVRHLGKVVGKAKGLVKIVAKNSIRKLRKKHAGLGESLSAQSLTSSATEERSDTTTAASGISIVVTSESDTDAKKDHGALIIKPSESKFSMTSAECRALPVYVSPSRPQNSTMPTIDSGPSTPHIDELDAFQIITVFQYGNPPEEDDTAPSDALIQDEDEDTASAPKRANAPMPTLNIDGALIENVLHIVLFLPWCVAVGGAILLMPSSAGALAFGGGFLRGPPPRGMRRVAYWAANAYEHVFVFLACAAALLYYDADPRRRMATLTVLGARVAWAWLGFQPKPRLHMRIGQDDMESLWLVWKGKAVVDALTETVGGAPEWRDVAYHDTAPPSSPTLCEDVCACHGVCAVTCPYFQKTLRDFAPRVCSG